MSIAVSQPSLPTIPSIAPDISDTAPGLLGRIGNTLSGIASGLASRIAPLVHQIPGAFKALSYPIEFTVTPLIGWSVPAQIMTSTAMTAAIVWAVWNFSEAIDNTFRKEPMNMLLRQFTELGCYRVVKFLSQYTWADIEATNNSDETPLHIAAANGDVKMIKALLEDLHVAANPENLAGETPLLAAARNGHHKAVNQLLKDDRTNLWHQDDRHETALHEAAAAPLKNVDLSKVTIDPTIVGADALIEKAEALAEEATAKDRAAGFDTSSAAIAKRKTASKKSKEAAAYYHAAIKAAGSEENPRPAEDLKELKDLADLCSNRVAAADSIEVSSILMTKSSERSLYEITDNFGETALFKAAQSGNTSLLHFYIADDCLPDRLDEDEETALHSAASFNQAAALKILAADGRTNLLIGQNEKGETPLHQAAKKGSLEAVKMLLSLYKEHSLDLKIKTENSENGKTAEDFAENSASENPGNPVFQEIQRLIHIATRAADALRNAEAAEEDLAAASIADADSVISLDTAAAPATA